MSTDKKKRCPKCKSDNLKQHKFVDGNLWICHNCGSRVEDEPETEIKGDNKDE
jgi:transposase-like protein